MSEELAKKFHEAYERLAPEHSYETRKASAVPWDDVPANNKALMIAVCSEVAGEQQAEIERLDERENTYKLKAEIERLNSRLKVLQESLHPTKDGYISHRIKDEITAALFDE